ncbi:uncharacterized protein EDB91DRAFT_1338624 [Suillus paluster]|uniref:uncharacterized protein n=1 Tax=Suillus paluster TaxID=48578 RepID=UPI001B885ADF|nr:uncharacterized protein EDB91DRAFT_1338624 [Suillus paluster]KAG1731192.1 hypothetical protein EDB91DRAFT_1338624 [Suillus paluster]
MSTSRYDLRSSNINRELGSAPYIPGALPATPISYESPLTVQDDPCRDVIQESIHRDPLRRCFMETYPTVFQVGLRLTPKTMGPAVTTARKTKVSVVEEFKLNQGQESLMREAERRVTNDGERERITVSDRRPGPQCWTHSGTLRGLNPENRSRDLQKATDSREWSGAGLEDGDIDGRPSVRPLHESYKAAKSTAEKSIRDP